MKNITIKPFAKFSKLQKQLSHDQKTAKTYQFFSTKNSIGPISHSLNPLNEKKAIDEARIRINQQWKDLSPKKIHTNKQLFNEAIKIPLVKYMLANKGINGYWTDYILNYPENRNLPISNLEKRILEEFPMVKATQERDQIFRKIAQEAVKNGAYLASIPCGLSRELLNLNYNNISKVNLYGIDIDQHSLTLSKSRAQNLLSKHNNNGANIRFITELCDAWELNHKEKFNLITSNGLTIYEKDDKRVSQLYKKFYEALKCNGILITSFITTSNEWDISKIDMSALDDQKILFMDIIAAKFQVFRSTKDVIESLNQVGFQQIRIISDNAFIFPTVIAKR